MKFFLILEVWLCYLFFSFLKLKINDIGICVWDLVVKYMYGWLVVYDKGLKYVCLSCIEWVLD